jgi:hypothetical protein
MLLNFGHPFCICVFLYKQIMLSIYQAAGISDHSI